MILIWGGLGKKSESQMGFEPTTLRDLVGCSNHLKYELWTIKIDIYKQK